MSSIIERKKKVKNGEYQYLDNDGLVILRVNYTNGIKHGTSIEYYPAEYSTYGKLKARKLMEQFNYINGILHGEWTRWYKNSQVELQANYIMESI